MRFGGPYPYFPSIPFGSFCQVRRKEFFMQIESDFHTRIHPKPSIYKSQLEKLGITPGAVAQFAGLSYSYIINQLNGMHRMSPRTEQKIQELIQIVSSER